ncbi:MAG TPA: peptide deformylase [Methylomirabilota bacterium]|nr:peptide deformylase [Methylomirabilota bacterium]
MAPLTVRRYGDPLLRRKAEPITAITPEIQRLIDQMIESMYYDLGIGLAAPQVGVSRRVIVMDDDQGKGPTALINPVITAARGQVAGEEGCLSLPGIFGEVVRAEWVSVSAQSRDGQPVSFEARGLLARVIQHEIDHLDGILFIDRLDKAQRDRIKRKIKREGLPDEAPHHALAL